MHAHTMTSLRLGLCISVEHMQSRSDTRVKLVLVDGFATNPKSALLITSLIDRCCMHSLSLSDDQLLA